MSWLEGFEGDLAPLRARLVQHPLFENLRTPADLGIFMQSHVFAVWDFMSLLKTLQRQVTCVSVPWTPPPNRLAARLVNEIVTGEESDEVEPGKFTSHFELYLEAMREADVCTRAIDKFVALQPPAAACAQSLEMAGAPAPARDFVLATLNLCRLEPHQVAAAFLYGREDIIPEMFLKILNGVADSRFAKLGFYLERHIEVDGGHHSRMARELMISLCGREARLWNEAFLAAGSALEARLALWDGILGVLRVAKSAHHTAEQPLRKKELLSLLAQ